MGLNSVSAGNDLPEAINVIIEIPAHSEPIKYEVDKTSGALFVDRFLSTCMYYPCDYGYIPQTLSEDGDPVDVCVLTPIPVNRGCVIECRPIGMLLMQDEAGEDKKILAVPVGRLTGLYDKVKGLEDIPESLLQQIAHFFGHYKDLEPGKWVKLSGWVGVNEAKAEIKASLQRYKENQ